MMKVVKIAQSANDIIEDEWLTTNFADVDWIELAMLAVDEVCAIANKDGNEKLWNRLAHINGSLQAILDRNLFETDDHKQVRELTKKERDK